MLSKYSVLIYSFSNDTSRIMYEMSNPCLCEGPITKHGDIDYEAVVKLSDGFNGADLRNVCTEAGLFAIRFLLLLVIHDFEKTILIIYRYVIEFRIIDNSTAINNVSEPI
jgi:SpoVK/Ycf46/Vps4 family AAA+-type ATPase